MKRKSTGERSRKRILKSKKSSMRSTRSRKTRNVTLRNSAVTPSLKGFAKIIWPGISNSTKFVQVPEFQSSVTYSQKSGTIVTANLMWYSVSHGSKILGHYDDDNDVCYIRKFIG